MPAFVRDPNGHIIAVQIDLNDARLDVLAYSWLRDRPDRRRPFPPRAAQRVAMCEEWLGQEMSDGGQAHHDTPGDDPVLTPKQIASEYRVDRRTAQRWCRKFGFEDDGRLFVRRSALAMVR
jgi:hypothetical protein